MKSDCGAKDKKNDNNKIGGATLFDENTGWFYDGSTKEEYIENLKKVILECITKPDEVVRRGANARNRAEKYIWQEKSREYQDINMKLLGKQTIDCKEELK